MNSHITADVHGFYTEFHKALDEAGCFTDPGPHKLIILSLLEQGAVILARGNHEDLYEEMITIDGARCQTSSRKLSQREAAIEAVRAVGLNQIAEIKPEWFQDQATRDMFFRRWRELC